MLFAAGWLLCVACCLLSVVFDICMILPNCCVLFVDGRGFCLLRGVCVLLRAVR